MFYSDYLGSNRSSWRLRIRGHGDFEDFPPIPVRPCWARSSVLPEIENQQQGVFNCAQLVVR
jgi:hypothetical protein